MIARLTLRADVMAYLRSREIVLPEIVLEQPEIEALQTADGKNNYTLALDSDFASPAVKIGELLITDGQAHVQIPTLRADFVLGVASRETSPVSATAIPTLPRLRKGW